MSESSFRAAVAAFLAGALLLAVVVTAILVPRPTEPSPSPIGTPAATAAAAPSVTATPILGPVFGPPGVVSVGLISRGSNSALTLEIEFVETSADAIPDAPGAFRVSISDDEGSGSTVAFVGTPSVSAPGSLGATVTLAGPNVLEVAIVASDTINVEPITISGLGISATSTAAIGPVTARLGDFSGSLEGGSASDLLPSPGSVIAPTP